MKIDIAIMLKYENRNCKLCLTMKIGTENGNC